MNHQDYATVLYKDVSTNPDLDIGPVIGMDKDLPPVEKVCLILHVLRIRNQAHLILPSPPNRPDVLRIKLIADDSIIELYPVKIVP